MSAVKLIACDLDNTLLKGPTTTSWQLIWDFLDADQEERRHGMRQYNSGAFSYADWCAHDARTFRKHQLKKAHFPEICRSLSPANGLRQTLDSLQSNDIQLVIISGALDIILHTAIPWYGLYFSEVFLNGCQFCDAGVLKHIEPTPYDFEGKLRCVQELCRRHNLDMDEVVFIGDGINDISLARQVGKTIAFGSDTPEILEAFDVILEDNDFRDILPHVLSD